MENRLLSYKERERPRPSWKAHYVVGIIVKKVEETLYVLCFKRRQGEMKEWLLRLPGSKQERKESCMDTLQRACLEKIGFTVPLPEWKEGPIAFQPEDRGKRPQIAFIADVSNYANVSFRTETKIIDAVHGKTACKEELAPPQWVRIEIALQTLFASHRALLLQSLPILQESGYARIINFDNPYIVGTGSCPSCHN